MSFLGQQRIRFGRGDPAGIAHYPRLIELIDVAIDELTLHGASVFGRAIDIDMARGLPTVAMEAQFERPRRLEEMLDLAVEVTPVGNTSVDVKVTETCAGAPRHTAALTQVMIDMGTANPNGGRLRGKRS